MGKMNKDELCTKLKRQLYRLGCYTCPVPKGDTTRWAVSEWIAHIDSLGSWEVYH